MLQYSFNTIFQFVNVVHDTYENYLILLLGPCALTYLEQVDLRLVQVSARWEKRRWHWTRDSTRFAEFSDLVRKKDKI